MSQVLPVQNNDELVSNIVYGILVEFCLLPNVIKLNMFRNDCFQSKSPRNAIVWN